MERVLLWVIKPKWSASTAHNNCSFTQKGVNYNNNNNNNNNVLLVLHMVALLY